MIKNLILLLGNLLNNILLIIIINSIKENEFGIETVKELIPNGENVQVTDSNK